MVPWDFLLCSATIRKELVNIETNVLKFEPPYLVPAILLFFSGSVSKNFATKLKLIQRFGIIKSELPPFVCTLFSRVEKYVTFRRVIFCSDFAQSQSFSTSNVNIYSQTQFHLRYVVELFKFLFVTTVLTLRFYTLVHAPSTV